MLRLPVGLDALDAQAAFVGAEEVVDFITAAVGHTVKAVTGSPTGCPGSCISSGDARG